MAIVRRDPFREIERLQPFGWEPFREIGSLRREMDQLFDRLMPTADTGQRGLAFIPSVEMDQTDHELHLKLEVPGLAPEDFNIEVTEDSVSIRGERKSESKTESEGLLRSEFHYGRFQRVIPLPTPIQSDRVKAEYKNGILNLTLPKSEPEQQKVVKVSVG